MLSTGAKIVLAERLLVEREQAAGERREEAGQRERQQLGARRAEAERLRVALVLAGRDEVAHVARMLQPAHRDAARGAGRRRTRSRTARSLRDVDVDPNGVHCGRRRDAVDEVVGQVVELDAERGSGRGSSRNDERRHRERERRDREQEPRMRSAGRPMMTDATAPTAPASRKLSTGSSCQCTLAAPAAAEPMATNATCPRLISPAQPVSEHERDGDDGVDRDGRGQVGVALARARTAAR